MYEKLHGRISFRNFQIISTKLLEAFLVFYMNVQSIREK